MPLKVKLPSPTLVKPPVPEIMPVKVVLPASPTVKLAMPKLMLPVVLLATSAIEATVSLKPARFQIAPSAILTAELSAMTLAFPLVSVPALIVVAPVYRLVPDKIKVPTPVLVKPPVPEIMPVKVVLLASPTVKLALPKLTLPVVLLATSAIEATVSLKPARFQIAPSAILTAELSAITLALPLVSVPALIVVTPEYRLVPDKIKVPTPVLVNAPVVAVLAPAKVRAFAVTSNVDVVPALRMKLRSVEADDPVYFKVPPLSTRLVAAFVAAPRFPARPPLPIVATLKIPALIVVTPV